MFKMRKALAKKRNILPRIHGINKMIHSVAEVRKRRELRQLNGGTIRQQFPFWRGLRGGGSHQFTNQGDPIIAASHRVIQELRKPSRTGPGGVVDYEIKNRHIQPQALALLLRGYFLLKR